MSQNKSYCRLNSWRSEGPCTNYGPCMCEAAATGARPVPAQTERTFDAQTWARSFNETLVALGHPPHDEEWLIGWFANAIMCGYDECSRRQEAALSAGGPQAPAEDQTSSGCGDLLSAHDHGNCEACNHIEAQESRFRAQPRIAVVSVSTPERG